MDSQKQQAANRVKEANSILVTVSNNPSVDQLAACIGLTIFLNKLGKHATAVFSGSVPSTIEFLKPEETLEKNTDSLRDFIIALDKSKADKLRYKVEDKVVKIFITPYKTSISDKDLEFSQGDFNVDAIVALGVHSQSDLDQVITAHGRILHDATVITVNINSGGDELGGINWLEPSASSLSELAAGLVSLIDKKQLDSQIATALLTGIVAATERFSNTQTSPQTMTVSAELMAAGADQQLVATKLEEPKPIEAVAPEPPVDDAITDSTASAEEQPKPDDGTLEIAHDASKEVAPLEAESSSDEEPEEPLVATSTPEPAPQVVSDPIEQSPQPGPTVSEPEVPTPPIITPEPATESPISPFVTEEPEVPAGPTVITPQIHIDEHGAISPISGDSLPPIVTASSEPPAIIRHHDDGPLQPPADAAPSEQSGFMHEPTGPTGGTQYANEDEEGPSGGAPGAGSGFIIGEHASGGGQDANTAPHTTESNAAVFEPQAPVVPESSLGVAQQQPDDNVAPSTSAAVVPGETLSDIERDVHSPHTQSPQELSPSQPESVNGIPQFEAPAANNQGVEPDLILGDAQAQPQVVASAQEEPDPLERARLAVAQAMEEQPPQPVIPAPNLVAPPQPAAVPLAASTPMPAAPVYDPNSPPPVPPPMMPPTTGGYTS